MLKLIKAEELSNEEIAETSKRMLIRLIVWIAAVVVPLVIAIVGIVIINGVEILTEVSYDLPPALAAALSIPFFILAAVHTFFAVLQLLNLMRVKKEQKARGV